MAFCGKCGTPLGADNVCPKCGTELGRDKIVISTQYKIKGKMVLTIVFGVWMLFLGLIFMFRGESIIQYYDIDISSELGEIVSMMIGIWLIYTAVGSVWVLNRQGKSCIDVYENGIKGVAISGTPNAWMPMNIKLENVELRYSDIQNCTTSKIKAQKKIILYTSYGNYEFLGGDNLQLVVNEINQRIATKIKT